MSDHDDFEFEPIPGIPGELPAGEHVIWRGSPDTGSVVKHVFHVHKMALYFGLLICAQWGHLLAGGQAPLQALAGLQGPVMFAAIALGILAILARASART